MNPETKIEFYKNRALGERFSAAIDFLKQNWKVICKIVLIIGIPEALIMGLGIQVYIQALEKIIMGNFSEPIFTIFIIFFLFFILSAISPATTGAIMVKYEKDGLSGVGFSQLFPIILSLTGKTLLFLLIFMLIITVFASIVGIFISFSYIAGTIVLILLLLLAFAGIIALAPSLSIIFFPAYFKGVGIFASMREAFRLGFKNWGSLFLALILISIIAGIVSTIFSLPFQLLISFNSFQVPFEISNIWTFIFAVISAFGNVLVAPVAIIFQAFQYFAIVEKEEGVSLKSKLDDFDNL